MRSVQPSPADPRDGGRLSDDLDGRLRAFFRAEMPEPWPVLQPPVSALVPRSAAAARRRPLSRSRLALAASAAFLLLGQLSLSGPFMDAAPVPAGSSEGGVAGRDARTKPKLYKPSPSRPAPTEDGEWLPENAPRRR
jgi:hypothetical protein